jgi:hypothetical protein
MFLTKVVTLLRVLKVTFQKACVFSTKWRGIWKHLGGIWKHVDASGRHMEASGSIWGASGGIWDKNIDFS